MLSKLIKINEPITQELIVYLKTTIKTDVNRFVTLNSIEQLGYILKFLEYKNIGLLVDNKQAEIFWINPYLNTNNILKVYNESGEFTDRCKHITFNETDIISAYYITIETVFKEILIPF